MVTPNEAYKISPTFCRYDIWTNMRHGPLFLIGNFHIQYGSKLQTWEVYVYFLPVFSWKRGKLNYWCNLGGSPSKLGPKTHFLPPLDCGQLYWWQFYRSFPKQKTPHDSFEETNLRPMRGVVTFLMFIWFICPFSFVLTMGKEIAKDYLLPTKITKIANGFFEEDGLSI